MVSQVEGDGRATGIRGRIGEMCYSSGLLPPLQRVRAMLQKELRILAYHRIMPVPDPDTYEFDLELISATPERFHEQMSRIKRHFRPMRLTDVVAAMDAGRPLPPNAVAITFDDGYDDNFHYAFPILRDLGIPATFFVSTGHIDTGRPFGYDWLMHMILLTSASRLELPELGIDVPMPAERARRRELGGDVLLQMKNIDAFAQEALITRLQTEWNLPCDHTPDDCRPMTWDQLRQMAAAGLEIGSHGVYHRMLAKMPPDAMVREVRESKATLDREIGADTVVMSYPVGGDRAFDRTVMDATREAGFDAACCYICGTNPNPASNRYALHRLPVERNMGPGWFAAMLALPSLMSYPTQHRENEREAEPACSS
jgi:peptidoglycan/xylan/chitin deacetylase (PgdA/CDA1 family)